MPSRLLNTSPTYSLRNTHNSSSVSLFRLINTKTTPLTQAENKKNNAKKMKPRISLYIHAEHFTNSQYSFSCCHLFQQPTGLKFGGRGGAFTRNPKMVEENRDRTLDPICLFPHYIYPSPPIRLCYHTHTQILLDTHTKGKLLEKESHVKQTQPLRQPSPAKQRET